MLMDQGFVKGQKMLKIKFPPLAGFLVGCQSRDFDFQVMVLGGRMLFVCQVLTSSVPTEHASAKSDLRKQTRKIISSAEIRTQDS